MKICQIKPTILVSEPAKSFVQRNCNYNVRSVMDAEIVLSRIRTCMRVCALFLPPPSAVACTVVEGGAVKPFAGT